MPIRVHKGLLSLAIASLLVAPAVIAQNVTASAVTGRVVNSQDKPVADATVKIVDTTTGATRIVTTNTSGRYNAVGLSVGGPYQITATLPSGAHAKRSGLFLELGRTSSINLVLAPTEGKPETLGAVQVVGSAQQLIFSPGNKGLTTNVSQEQLRDTPTPGRSIAEIARLNPMLNIVDTGTNSISLAGLNNRYNNITVDGVGQNDTFGLNSNGLPTIGSPISQNAIAGYQISSSDYAVSSDTVGASINAVTKSGTNNYHGSVYYAYRNGNSLVGDAGWLSKDRGYTGYDTDWTGGVTLGGPIIKNKLFFFVDLEKEKTTGIGAGGNTGLDPSLGNGPSTSNKVSPGDLQRIIDTATALGMQPGTFGAGAVNLENRRYLAKLSWHIDDNHRMDFTYQQTKETEPDPEGNDSDSIGLTSYWHTNAVSLKNLVLQSFDNWSDNFSTETKISYQNFDTQHLTPGDQPEVEVKLGQDAQGNPNGSGPTVLLGNDISYMANHTDVKTYNFFTQGTLFLGNHTLKGGINFERNNIDDLFVQRLFGEYVFWGLNNLAARNYDEFLINQPAKGFTLDQLAGQWNLNQWALFLQDTWQINRSLSIQYGLRYDKDFTDDRPRLDQDFLSTYGVNNSNTIDGRKLVEPRISFNYQFDTQVPTQLHGGFGLFESNPPMVWLTNSFENPGVNVNTFRSFGDEKGAPAFSPNAHDQPVPAKAEGAEATVDAITPGFQLPAVWKASLAFNRELPFWHTIFTAEAMLIRPRDAIWYTDPDIGAPDAQRLPDGRFQYWATPGQVPKSSDERANGATGFSGDSAILANTSRGRAASFTLALDKPFSHGWTARLSATFNHSNNINPGTSSVASSNFQDRAYVNPNDAELGISNYEVRERYTLSATWRHDFFSHYATTISAFFNVASGLPYSWVFGNDANGDGFESDLAFIPKPGQVDFQAGTSASTIQQFYAFIAGNKYLSQHAGGIATRDGDNVPWTHELDMTFRQQIPGLFRGNVGVLRFDIFNFLNLLDSHWGLQDEPPFFGRTLANYEGVGKDGKYIYSLPTDANGNYQPTQLNVYDAGGTIKTNVVSRWSVMATVTYRF